MVKICIFQLKDKNNPNLFRGWRESSEDDEYPFNPEDYTCVYSTDSTKLSITVENILNSIFDIFNVSHPKDFFGHSLSVSDIVLLDGERTGCFYCDTFGWKDIKEHYLKFEELKN